VSLVTLVFRLERTALVTDFGPFTIEPASISRMGAADFGSFVGRLLATEVAAHGMAGVTLETTYLENVGDGGVDAGLRHAFKTSWIPAGDSAWQFKAGDLGPAKCREELKGATRALEVLQAGGHYRLVLGATLTSKKIAARRTELVSVATSSGILDADKRIDVISADGLARWIETYPALAVSPLLRGIGRRVLTHEEWVDSHPHDTTWVTSPKRDVQVESLRASVASPTATTSRLEGVSGLGKSRLALESLTDPMFSALVVYAPAADQFQIDLLIQLRSQGRVAIVVIDECDRKQHEVYASVLSSSSTLKVVTIGEPGDRSTRSPILGLLSFEDEQMHGLLRANRPGLSPEAERVVVQVAAGNIDYALKLADVAAEGQADSAGTLISEDDLRAFFSKQLPDGQLFLASCALALFSRFGFEGEPGKELNLIAENLGFSRIELRTAAAGLERSGLLSKQGRFRSVGPHPVGVYLAARGWEEFGEQVVSHLLPNVDADLTERLFRRAIDIGRLDVNSPAMSAVLAEDGPLASLEFMADKNNPQLLTHFAVLAPDAVAARLAETIHAATEEELAHFTDLRRDLVWTLGKLAWNSTTFLLSADCLLALAVAENETYSNNATGTWVELFGSQLPGTSADPAVRSEYLRQKSLSADPRVRELVIRAASRVLEPHESIMASSELQGGVVVEPRGRPTTWDEYFAYQNSAIDVLAELSSDSVATVREQAANGLVSSIHGLLEEDSSREYLSRVTADLSPAVLAKVRIEVEGLRSLFDRVEATDSRPQALDAFEANLPIATPMDRLKTLANTRTWDRGTEELARNLSEVAVEADHENTLDLLTQVLLESPDLPAAYAVGRAVRSLGNDYSEAVPKLEAFAGTLNGEALIGYLHALVNEGDQDAFDRYLEHADLPAAVALHYSTRGPRTAPAARRIERLVPRVSIPEAARDLFVWMRDEDGPKVASYLRQWEARLSTQEDYNAAVDFAAMQVFRRPEPVADLDAAIFSLVPRRREYPNVGQESYDWSTLARRKLNEDPLYVVSLIADLVESDSIKAFSGSEENRLLAKATRLGGEAAWVQLMDRMEKGEWRLSFSAREWLGNAAELEWACRWVGDDVTRAGVLANVTKPGGADLSPIAQYLIEHFAHDSSVSSRLAGQFISGMWTGNESDRIKSQVTQVQGWVSASPEAHELRKWGRALIADLENRLGRVTRDEEERGW
jgi:hypothetical protein